MKCDVGKCNEWAESELGSGGWKFKTCKKHNPAIADLLDDYYRELLRLQKIYREKIWNLEE